MINFYYLCKEFARSAPHARGRKPGRFTKQRTEASTSPHVTGISTTRLPGKHGTAAPLYSKNARKC